MPEPVDLEVALRAARERVVEAMWAWAYSDEALAMMQYEKDRDAALDQYEALARAVGAADNHSDPKSEETVYGRAERLAREVLMHSEQERTN